MMLIPHTTRMILAGAVACISASVWSADTLRPDAPGIALTAAVGAEVIPAIPLSAALPGESIPEPVARMMAQATPSVTAPAEKAAAASVSTVIPLASIKEAQKGEFVQVEGTASGYRASNNPRAPHSFQLKDSVGSTLRVAIWDDVFSGLPADVSSAIKNSAGTLKMRAKVSMFKEQVELHPGAGDVSVGGGEVAPKVAAAAVPSAASPDGTINPGSITKADLGKTVTVKGRVESARKPSNERAPFLLKLSGVDGGGGIDLVFWTDTQKAIPAKHQAEPGDMVTVKGTVGEHRGTLQLKLESPDELKVTARGDNVTKGPQSAVKGKSVAVAEIANLPAGTAVEIKATIMESAPVPLGNRLVVADPAIKSATATVLFYDNALRPDYRPETGKTMTLNGATMALESGETVIVVTK